MHILEQRDAFLARELRPDLIVYARGASTVSLYAGQGSTDFWGANASDAFDLTEMRAFHILAVELILGGVLTTPQEGDRITDAAGTWEVVRPPGDDAPEPWHYLGHDRLIISVMAWQGRG